MNQGRNRFVLSGRRYICVFCGGWERCELRKGIDSCGLGKWRGRCVLVVRWEMCLHREGMDWFFFQIIEGKFCIKERVGQVCCEGWFVPVCTEGRKGNVCIEGRFGHV